MQTATYKVPGGKLVRLKARVEDGKIHGVQISGDFFLSPPEKIEALEEAVEGFAVDDPEALEEVLAYVIDRDNILIEGFTPADVAKAMEGFDV